MTRIRNCPRLHGDKTGVRDGPWGEALAKCLLFLAEPGPRFVVLLGPRGTGKTQFAVDLMRELSQGFSKHQEVAYFTLYEVFRAVKDGYRENKSEADALYNVCHDTLITIDEMNVRGKTAWEDNLLTHILDVRYVGRLLTVLITNETHEAFVKSVGDSAYDRIVECGRVVDTTAWPVRRIPR
jgi:DNA replication protein DnaC